MNDATSTKTSDSLQTAFFAGVARGRRQERQSILDHLANRREWLMTGIRALDEVIELIQKLEQK